MTIVCQHCGKQLSESQYRKGKQYKSCPKCSSDNGGEHVYYKYPENFGTTPLRASTNSPEGAQSYCYSCRDRGTLSEPGILCSAFSGYE
jgi:phage FluMu protein Com